MAGPKKTGRLVKRERGREMWRGKEGGVVGMGERGCTTQLKKIYNT